MSSLTACVIIGSDRINVTSSTSITSINGVVLMSHITWPSLLPTLIDMALDSWGSALAAHAVIGFGDESDFDDAATIYRRDHLADVLVISVGIGSDMDLGLRHLDRFAFNPIHQ